MKCETRPLTPPGTPASVSTARVLLVEEARRVIPGATSGLPCAAGGRTPASESGPNASADSWGKLQLSSGGSCRRQVCEAV
jgi:hypothetical protein